MKITEFAKEICKEEGKKKQTDIAQVMEILKVIDRLTNGILYRLIRWI